MKIVSAVFLLAILAYLGVYAASSLSDPYHTVTAVDYTQRETIRVEGMVVRDEEVIETYYDSVYTAVTEGRRVSRGGTVAVVYSSDEELARAERLRAVTGEIESLEELKAAGASDSQKLESGIKKEILSLRMAAENREFSQLADYTANINALLITIGSNEGGIEDELQALYGERERLQAGAAEPYAVLKATGSGLYSSALDGYETIGPAQLEDLTVPVLQQMMSRELSASELGIGKLVYGSKWYYAALLPEEEAPELDPGDDVTLIFGLYYSEYLDMEVVSVSEAEDGQLAVVFSCSEALSDVLGMRMQSAQIVLHEDEGLRVPRRAVRVDEERRVYVYVQTGLQAEKKYVTIMHDLGSHYVVDSEELHNGDLVIVGGKDLYDGKVVA